MKPNHDIYELETLTENNGVVLSRVKRTDGEPIDEADLIEACSDKHVTAEIRYVSTDRKVMFVKQFFRMVGGAQ